MDAETLKNIHDVTKVLDKVLADTEEGKLLRYHLKEPLSELSSLLTDEAPKPKVEKWQPKGGNCIVFSSGRVDIDVTATEGEYESNRMFGTTYATLKQAEKARDSMRTHNRLLAWLSENDDGWVADWKDDSQKKYFVYCGNYHKLWGHASTIEHKLLGNLFMSKSNAEKLCKLLNDGVVEL